MSDMMMKEAKALLWQIGWNRGLTLVPMLYFGIGARVFYFIKMSLMPYIN